MAWVWSGNERKRLYMYMYIVYVVLKLRIRIQNYGFTNVRLYSNCVYMYMLIQAAIFRRYNYLWLSFLLHDVHVCNHVTYMCMYRLKELTISISYMYVKNHFLKYCTKATCTCIFHKKNDEPLYTNTCAVVKYTYCTYQCTFDVALGKSDSNHCCPINWAMYSGRGVGGGGGGGGVGVRGGGGGVGVRGLGGGDLGLGFGATIFSTLIWVFNSYQKQ